MGTTCEDCSVGSYQDKIWQTMCIPCGDSMTTLREGATSITECMRKCRGDWGKLLQFSVKDTFCEKYVRCIISLRVYIKFIIRVNNLYHIIYIPY